jgi:hypothetical protein
MGWTWAERKAPSAWLVDGRAVDRGEGTVLQVPAGGRVLAFRDVHGPFTGVLVFTQPSQRAWVNDDGLFWLWGRAGGAPVELPVVAYALVPAALSPEEVAALADAVSEPPAGVSSGAVAGERPAWAVRVERGRSAPVPPALAPLFADQKAAVSVPSVAGPLLLLPGRECRTELPVPPELERPLPAFDRGVGAGEKALVARHVEEVLAHRAPDSRFTFSEGRTFYDGFVCAALSQVLPLLERPLRGTTAQAVGECLDTLCDHHVRSRAYGLLVPPEQPAFIESAVDYPEITSCLLYGMLAYALNVDRDYPKRWAELLATHVRQIAEMSSLCGVAYAAAEPTRLHVIAESAVGGYLAWASLYHLGRLTSAPWTGEARARAALAWSSYRQLFRWRPEFGETGVVNGWADWCAQVKTPEPWAFVQTCWFSFIPLIPYEHEDRYGLWRSLRAQPWWRYTAGPPPTQRGYDFANALALARAGYPEEVKAHWREVLDRPFSWETFDYTPVLALAAIPQLAALGALP